MKKIAILVLLVLVVALVGCGEVQQDTIKPDVQEDDKPADSGSTVVKKADTTKSEPAEESEPAMTETKKVSYELSSEERSKLEAKLKPGAKVELSSSFKTVGLDDVIVVGLGIVNNENDPMTYIIKPKIESVKRTIGPGSYEELTTTADLSDWLAKNDFDEFIINQKQDKIIPVIIEIGDMITPTRETETGTRINLQLEVKTITRRGFEEDYSEATLSIKVQ